MTSICHCCIDCSFLESLFSLNYQDLKAGCNCCDLLCFCLKEVIINWHPHGMIMINLSEIFGTMSGTVHSINYHCLQNKTKISLIRTRWSAVFADPTHATFTFFCIPQILNISKAQVFVLILSPLNTRIKTFVSFQK